MYLRSISALGLKQMLKIFIVKKMIVSCAHKIRLANVYPNCIIQSPFVVQE